MTAIQAKNKTVETLENLIPLSTRLLFNHEIEKEANKGNLSCAIEKNDIIFRLDKSTADQMIEIFNYYILLGYKVELNHYEDFIISWA
jgi:hypothetical protein